MKTLNMIKSAAVLLFVLGGVQVAFAGADDGVWVAPAAANELKKAGADGVQVTGAGKNLTRYEAVGNK